MNHFWFYSSPNHCDTKTHKKNPKTSVLGSKPNPAQSWTTRNQSQKFSLFNPKILGLNHTAYHDRKYNLCHYMAFKLKIFQVGKFPISWSLTKLQVLVSTRSPLYVDLLFFLDRRVSIVGMPGKSSFFVSLSSLSLSLSLYPFSFSTFLPLLLLIH